MVKKQFFSQLATLETLFKYWDEGKMVDIKVIDTTVENVIDDIIDVPGSVGSDASGPQTLCLWELHFLEKEPHPHFQTSLRAWM